MAVAKKIVLKVPGTNLQSIARDREKKLGHCNVKLQFMTWQTMKLFNYLFIVIAQKITFD